MEIIPSCEECLFQKQESLVSGEKDLGKKKAYLKEIKDILYGNRKYNCAPYMVYCFNQVYKKYYGHPKDYFETKKKYNQIVLSIEKEIEEKINRSEDPLKTALVYARTGNYVDFGALDHVDPDEFLALLNKNDTTLDMKTYAAFLKECGQGKSFLLLCDNCGEIVLDKLFLRCLKKQFPHLQIYVMVRGDDVLNDATMADARECALDREFKVLTNGGGIAGTIPGMLDEKTRKILEDADVILSKGQGNYESMGGSGRNVYFSFLCKCQRFTTRFQVPKLTGMFVSELPK